MPKAKDITGDLGKLRGVGVFPKGDKAPVFQKEADESLARTFAFNLPGWLIMVSIAAFVIVQFSFLIWIA